MVTVIAKIIVKRSARQKSGEVIIDLKFSAPALVISNSLNKSCESEVFIPRYVGQITNRAKKKRKGEANKNAGNLFFLFCFN